eukprot:m.437340 g.437340  ORF g.437340 m.437340 type:complete len:437 (+) comp18101_c0_seq1:262-1572(+)
MGGSFSTTNAVWVQTEKPSYFEGDVVNGTIYLNCIKAFQCKGLHIEVHGEERTSWVTHHTRTDAEGRQHQDTRHHYGHFEFFKQRVLVYNFGGHVTEGQYTFPFQFQLPHGMPGVFNAEAGRGRRSEKDHAYIQYRITSECDVRGFFNFDIKHTQHMVVQQRLMQPITQLRLECTEQVTACCCFNKGQAHLAAHLDKSAYVPGENVGIISEITNTSQENFGNVRVELRRRMTLRSTNDNETETTDEKVANNTYTGVTAGEVRTGANAMSLPLGLPMDISPSTQGRLIHCEYYVDVVYVASSAIVRNLHVKVPVTIYAPPPPPTMFVQQLPPGWHGQQMAPTQLALPTPSAPPPSGAYGAPPPQPPMGGGYVEAGDKAPLLGGGGGGYGAAPGYGGQPPPSGAPYGGYGGQPPPPGPPYGGAPVQQQQPGYQQPGGY